MYGLAPDLTVKCSPVLENEISENKLLSASKISGQFLHAFYQKPCASHNSTHIAQTEGNHFKGLSTIPEMLPLHFIQKLQSPRQSQG